MLLWIIAGLLAIGVLGLACSWVLRARSGLDPMYQSDPDRAPRVEPDAQLNPIRRRGTRQSGAL